MYGYRTRCSLCALPAVHTAFVDTSMAPPLRADQTVTLHRINNHKPYTAAAPAPAIAAAARCQRSDRGSGGSGGGRSQTAAWWLVCEGLGGRPFVVWCGLDVVQGEEAMDMSRNMSRKIGCVAVADAEVEAAAQHG